MGNISVHHRSDKRKPLHMRDPQSWLQLSVHPMKIYELTRLSLFRTVAAGIFLLWYKVLENPLKSPADI